MAHFDFLHVGESDVASGVDASDGYKDVLMAGELMKWCALYGPPRA